MKEVTIKDKVSNMNFEELFAELNRKHLILDLNNAKNKFKKERLLKSKNTLSEYTKIYNKTANINITHSLNTCKSFSFPNINNSPSETKRIDIKIKLNNIEKNISYPSQFFYEKPKFENKRTNQQNILKEISSAKEEKLLKAKYGYTKNIFHKKLKGRELSQTINRKEFQRISDKREELIKKHNDIQEEIKKQNFIREKKLTLMDPFSKDNQFNKLFDKESIRKNITKINFFNRQGKRTDEVIKDNKISINTTNRQCDSQIKKHLSNTIDDNDFIFLVNKISKKYNNIKDN